MPNRFIRDSLLDSEEIHAASAAARWLYTTILLGADCDGRFDPSNYLSRVKEFDCLINVGLVRRLDDGRYIAIKFRDHVSMPSAYAKASRAAYGAARYARCTSPMSAEHKNEIDAIYMAAAEATSLTGTPHNVDHIVPVKGKLVSGLHVPWNLRVITAMENRKKSNKFNDGRQ